MIALMTGKRLGGPSSSTVAQQRGVSTSGTGGSGQERGLWGSMESINRHAQGGQLWQLVGVDLLKMYIVNNIDILDCLDTQSKFLNLLVIIGFHTSRD